MSDIATNRKALRDYQIQERIEAGLALVGTEVKSIRAGQVQLNDAFARIDKGRAILHQCDIQPYDKASHTQHDPRRPRVLLLHKREIRHLAAASQIKGCTIVALRLYWKGPHVKVELGIGKGRNKGDQREHDKIKGLDRDVRRAMSSFNKSRV
jgi:SsrA-binding protein